MTSFRHILVATDCSPCAEAAAAAALRLAIPLRATVDVVTVVDTSGWTDAPGPPESGRQRAAQAREQARERAQGFAARHLGGLEQLRVHVRDAQDTAGEIVRAAADLGSDLIVLGTHGTTGLAHLVLGSVAEKVVRGSPLPVLTVRTRA